MDVLCNIYNLLCLDELATTSLDVKSLYPSLLHTQTSAAIKFFGNNCKWDGNTINFMTDSFLAIQQTAYSKHSNYDSCRIIAKQIKGIAMGACDSPYDANLTLLHWEFNNLATIS